MLAQPMSLLPFFEDLTDPRQDAKVTYPLPEMIFLTMSAAIANCDCWTEIEEYCDQHIDFFREYLPLENGVPSHDTFSRVFSLLDPAAFSECLIKWVEALQLDLTGKGIHIDGKTLRRSFDKAAGTGALQVVTAWAGEMHLCLGQLAVEEGSNERTAVPKLIEMLELAGAVVTLDALHTTKSTAKQLREKKAHYVLTVKGNQPKLHGLISRTFEELGAKNYQHPRVRCHATHEKNGGREEMRCYTVFPAPAEVRKLGWRDVKTIGMVYRERTVKGKTSTELIYFISSLEPKVRELAKHVRDHWKIENELHWSLDVTFSEDASRIRKGEGPANASVFRRLALMFVKRYKHEKGSMRMKRLRASWSSEKLLQYLTGNPA